MKQYLYYQGETIQERKLFKGGNNMLEKVFDWGNNSREDTIQGRILIKEIWHAYTFNTYTRVYVMFQQRHGLRTPNEGRE